MVYEVYKIQNRLNNKIYIGISSAGYEKRFKHHLSESRNGSTFILHNAIRKYGEEAFTSTLLEICDTIEILKEREKFWILTLDTTNRDKGYNMTLGGDGTFGRLHSDETKQKISEKALGRNKVTTLVTIVNNNTNVTDAYFSMDKASLALNKGRNYINHLKIKYNSTTFIHNEYTITLSTPIKELKIKSTISKEAASLRAKKGWITIYKNLDSFSKAQKEACVKGGRTKVIQQLDLEGNVVAEHLGSREAAKAVTGNRSPIQHCLKNRIQTAYGYKWKYKDNS